MYMTYLAFSETYLSKHGTLAIKFVTYPKNYAYVADSNVQPRGFMQQKAETITIY